MLEITIPERELWDEDKQEFFYVKEQKIQLEHSLISISKWESKWHKAFLTEKPKSFEETIDYIKCMTVTRNVDSFVYSLLSQSNIEEINNYIESPMTATYISNETNRTKGIKKDVVTSELIYYWMISFGIPFECQKWHLNRLLALIEVCNIKNKPPKKMSKKSLYKHHSAVNAANRKRFKTRG